MISIVMGYFNRLELLDFTLKTISQSQHSDYEIIIIDDFSTEPQNPEHLKLRYPNMDLRVVKMKDVYKTKTYENPCIPYNIGFEKAKGDKIIIQNPECCHVGDVITYTENNLTDKEYLSFHCYASTQEELANIHGGETLKINNTSTRVTDGGCWYNHEVYRSQSFHFTSAITRNRLAELNGFDERFAYGNSYDDNEFASRVKKLLPIKFVRDPYVIHQYHQKTVTGNIDQIRQNRQKNKQLFNEIQKREPSNIRAHNNGKQIIQ